MSTKEKSPCQTVNIENERLYQVRACKKVSLCQFEDSKKELRSQRLNEVALG